MNSHIFCGQLNQRNDVIKNPFICVTCPLFVWIQRCNDVLLLSPKILWTKAHSFSIHSEQLYKSNGRNYRIHLQCWDTRCTNFLFKFIYCSHVKKFSLHMCEFPGTPVVKRGLYLINNTKWGFLIGFGMLAK